MCLMKGTILALFVFHIAAVRSLEREDQLPTTTHGHITRRADPAGPGTSSIADTTKHGTTSPAGEAGLNEAPKRVTLELITNSTGCYVELDVGTPAKTFRLVLDTGSSETWIIGRDEPDYARRWYDPTASSSAQRIEGLNMVTMRYMGGESATFNEYTDTVTLKDLTIRNVPIGVAHTWSDDLLGITGNGILALGLSSLAQTGQKSFLNVLFEQGLVAEPCFSVRLINPRWIDNMEDTSILTLGGFDPMAMDGEESTDLKVYSDVHWSVLADSIHIDGVPTPIAISVLAVLDTGTSVIIGSLDPVRKLHRAIPGSREDVKPTAQGFLLFIIPCDSTAVITFVFAGRPFQLSSEQLTNRQIPGTSDCWSNIVASVSNRGAGSFWLLGLPFLYTVYTKYTFPQANGSPARVSFAKLREPQWLPGRSPADLRSQSEDSDNSVD